MSGRTLQGAIILLVIGNLAAIFSDIIIKVQGSDIPLFQFVFMRLLCTLAILAPFLPMIDRKQLFRGTRIHLVRAQISIIGVACMVVALTNLPLATANALFYAAPLIVMVLAVAVFRERATGLSVFAVISGFIGILVILRPLEFSWQGVSALVAAAALGTNALLVRKLPWGQSMAHILLLTHVYGLPVALVLMLWEGAAWDWTLMTAALGSAVFILGYHTTVILAYRHVAANQVTSAEYTGLIWAIAFGWWWFQEVPDVWFFIGSALIVGPLVLLSLAERRRTRGTTPVAAQPATHPD
ncbi:DMT family transporter [Aquisalimonas sp. 2447]|uniref:DMT family transporter n=1 Tax=Aquisalimonas sp. 2447 TaxID=2740807 RepID=UPI0014326C83|nr:DMT family transporter [Aquisalimonas sp. 2447]QIT55320.1 DMT family transporter [Aquisalimonas sp. 2447]